MRCVLKVRVLGSKHDVAEKGVLGVGGHRAVDRAIIGTRCREGSRDFGALAEDLVVARRCEEVETLGRDLARRTRSRPRQDDDVVVGIVADVAERVDKASCT